ncbi:hypothetical protein KY290_010291 [Solanum tuberosum]|uniref:Tf2-1-like SH3-like domain-containing protein n=1 Tax=Solanum tuberosum TaxID=4113 RepID=A0ABQ7VXG1_SOLTU|nr:hypothetical protein KY290_010291 [Solanum tuberosum]
MPSVYFLNGLKPELGDAVRIHRSYSLPHAYHLARLHEFIFSKQWRAAMKNQPYSYANPQTIPNLHLPKPPPPIVADRPRKRRLTPAELSDKRAKRLCYICDEKYEQGHVYKTNAQLFLMELEEEGVALEEEGELLQLPEVVETCEISIHAMIGIKGYRTFRLTGHCHKKALNILIDTGSTHNFMDSGLVARIGWKMTMKFEYEGKILCLQVTPREETFSQDSKTIPLVEMPGEVQQLLQQNNLYARLSKCQFATNSIEYLGHYISAARVATDPKKILAVQQWPKPTTLKQIRGFLGLTGFKWTEGATKAFQNLKDALTSAPLGQPIAYLSKGLSLHHQAMSVYDKEFLVLGKENKAADALSSIPAVELASLTLGVVRSDLLQTIMNSWDSDPELRKLIHKLSILNEDIKGFSFINQQLRWNGRLGLRKDVEDYIKGCEICQKSKYDKAAYPRLLQPLAIPSLSWASVSMDFIEGLPKSKGKEVIWVVHVFKLHDLSEDIVSDRDPIFTSNVWQKLFAMQGVTLKTSTTYHPQTARQTETTPYKALYGQPPPLHLPYLQGESEVIEVDRSLVTKEFKLQLLEFHLSRERQRMVDQANKKRSDRKFQPRGWVFLKVQPYRQITLSNKHFSKLSYKYYGPYQVLPMVGTVAYTLSLPFQLLLHPIFHVSILKPCYKVPTTVSHPHVLDLSNPYCPVPSKVLDRRMVQQDNKAVVQLLIQWENFQLIKPHGRIFIH